MPVYEIVNPNAILNRNIFFGIEPGILVILALLVFDYSVSRRGWCRYFCPQGAVYSLIGKFSPLRVKLRSAQECQKCYTCEQSCPIGIPLSDYISKDEAVSDKECTKCGECIDACKAKTLYLGWR